MKINSVIQNQVNFTGEEKPKVKSRGAKAYVSFIMPGTGQFCDGRNQDGKKYLLGWAGLQLGAGVWGISFINSMFKSASELKMPSKAKILTGFGLFAASLGVRIASSVNAYKGGDGEYEAESKENKKRHGGKAVASSFIPGLGQFCDGRIKAGLGFLAGAIGLGVLSRLSTKPMLKELKNFEKAAMELKELPAIKIGASKMLAPMIIGLGSTGLWIANVVDAYKGRKEEANV